MGWKYRSPSLFPARYPSAVRSAHEKLGTPVLLHSGSFSDLASDAENFRFYRWCVLQRQDFNREISRIIAGFTLRTSIERVSNIDGALYLTINKSLMSDFIEQNPELSDQIFSDCQ